MTLPNLVNSPDTPDMTALKKWREIRSNSRDTLLAKNQNADINVDCTAGGTIVLSVIDVALQDENIHLRLTGTPGAGYTIEFADGNKQIMIENQSGQTATIETTTGAASPPTVLNGATAVFQIRGTDISTIGNVGLQTGALLHSGQVDPTAGIDFTDFVIKKAEFKDVAFKVDTPSSSSGTLVLDLENGNYFDVTLTEDVTTLTLSNPLDNPSSLVLEDISGGILLEDGSGVLLLEEANAMSSLVFIATQNTGGGHDITWPANVQWEQDTGGSPAQTTSANAVDIYWLFTVNGGSTWFGFVLGLDMG